MYAFSNQLTLAAGFGSPWLLGALVLGLIPVLFHLFHRRRYRETPWAAMQFLMAASHRQSRRLRLERLLLLTVRTLVLVLLVLAMARPYVQSDGEFLESGEPVRRILVIDCSFSMQHRPANRSLFEKAIDAADGILSRANSGDTCQIIRIGGQEPRVVVRRPAYRDSDIRQVLRQLQPSAEQGDLLASLRAALDLVDSADPREPVELYFISDMQQETWWSDELSRNREIVSLLDRLEKTARVTLVDVGSPGLGNLVVTDLAAESSINMVNRPIRIRAVVRNEISTENRTVPVELLVDEQVHQRKVIDLEPGEEATIPFDLVIDRPGQAVVEVRIVPDQLTIDDQRWLVLDVKSQVDILLVDGHGTSDSRSASFYLSTALEPMVDSDRPPMRTEVVSDGRLDELPLTEYDCIMLCDVGVVTDSEVTRLESYVSKGGGLVLMPGERCSLETWNELLFRSGRGLLPARLQQRVGNPENPERLYRFLLDELPHPILDPYRGNPGMGLERPLTLDFFGVQIPARSSAEVVLRFDDASPAIVEKSFGLGQVVLLTTPWDDSRWNTLARRDGDVLVALTHEIVNFVVSQSHRSDELLVGQTFSRTLSADQAFVKLRMSGPRDRRLSLVDRPVDGGGRRYTTGFIEPGIYRLEESQSGRQEVLAVNVDPRESLLARVSDRILIEQLAGGRREYVLNGIGPELLVPEVDGTQQAGLERWLFYAVLVCLVWEQLLAWKPSVGIASLPFVLLIPCGVWLPPVIWPILLGLAVLVLQIPGLLRRTG